MGARLLICHLMQKLRFHRLWRTARLGVILCSGLAVHDVLLAQAVVYPIPTPYTETAVPLAPFSVEFPSGQAPVGGQGVGVSVGNAAHQTGRVADYVIDATLDPARHAVDGRERLTWRNRSARMVSVLYLMADGTPDDNDVHLRDVKQNGVAVPWRLARHEHGPANGHDVVQLTLPAPVMPGESTTLDITFLNQLPRMAAYGGLYGMVHLAALWFPKMAVLELPGESGATEMRWNVHASARAHADASRHDVRLTAPQAYTVSATGQLQEAPVERNGMLIHHYVQTGVQDFAWTADKHFGWAHWIAGALALLLPCAVLARRRVARQHAPIATDAGGKP